MKKVFLGSLMILVSVYNYAQKDSSRSTIGGLFKKANSVLNNSKSSSSSLSTNEIVAGLKEALTVGAQNSTGKLSAANGFFKDAAVKVLMPEEMRKVESRLRSLGMGK